MSRHGLKRNNNEQYIHLLVQDFHPLKQINMNIKIIKYKMITEFIPTQKETFYSWLSPHNLNYKNNVKNVTFV